MSSKQSQTQEFLGDRAAIVSAFRNRDFCALWIGQLLSQIGDSFVLVAILFVINTLTDSPLALGVLAVVATLPQLGQNLAGSGLGQAHRFLVSEIGTYSIFDFLERGYMRRLFFEYLKEAVAVSYP